MNTFQLKIIACAAMLIDHIGAVFFPDWFLLRIVGRIAFPIFAFLLTQGYIHTGNLKNYFIRLGIFAVLSEFPFRLAFHSGSHNIFFTLFIGLGTVHIVQQLKQNWLSKILVILLGILAQILNTDYGLYGILTIYFFYLYQKEERWRNLSFILLNVVYHIPLIPSLFIKGVEIFIQMFSTVSLWIIHQYNGEQGRPLKYWFYVFYPGHLFLIIGVRFLLQQ